MCNRRVLNIEGAFMGQVKILFWWVTKRRFLEMSDAVKWLGYEEED